MTEELDPKARTQAILDRNDRMIRRLESIGGGNVRSYKDLSDIADVLDLKPDPPTTEQLRQIREMLIEQQEAITRLIAIIDRSLSTSHSEPPMT